MNPKFDTSLIKSYKSNAQITRILSENWVKNNIYCPGCGNESLNSFENNRPVADFYCTKCSEEFELKSKAGKLNNTITDGAYSKMIERINSEKNPNFFFLTYSKNWSVNDFLIIPKQFFTDEIIIKRSPLSKNARRAGWIGCNIDISRISESGKVFLMKNSKAIDRNIVKMSFNKTLFLRQKSSEAKGWILDVLRCVDEINTDEFTLKDVYNFEQNLSMKYPKNKFIKDKIRQQLQILRDMEIIEFISPGKYKKIKYANI